MDKIVKHCDNCAYKKHTMLGNICRLSGYHCDIERQYPTRCGVNFEKWMPRESIFQNFFNKVFGYIK